MSSPVPDTFPSLFYGYTATWLIISVYVLYLASKLRKIEKSKDE